jgi:CRISPR system Cascade subunit CasA
MTMSFDVLEQPWIPTRRLGGRMTSVGLREAFLSAHEIEDICLPVPPAASGLWRILYALAARITRLDDSREETDYTDAQGRLEWLDDRKALFATGRFDAGSVTEYFDRFADRFDLFGPSPWLQDPRLLEQCTKTSGINKLVFARPSGNNHAWWSHTDDINPQTLPTREAAWWLIAQLYFGASGRCTTRAVGNISSASTKAGPLRSAISFHPAGRNLFESLLAGLPAPEASHDDAPEDACPWEADLPDPSVPLRNVTWPGRLLAGRARHAVLLIPSRDGTQVVDAYLTWATQQSPESVDPYVVQDLSKEGKLYTRRADADRALWRDLDALVLESSDGGKRPRVLTDAAYLPLELQTALRVRAYGFDQDGQAADKQYFTAITPPLFKFTDQNTARLARECRDAAEKVARMLALAAKTAWNESAGAMGAKPDRRGNGPWANRALAQYWPQAEQSFWDLVELREKGEPLTVFVAQAQLALDSAVGQAAATQPGAKALSHATAILRSALPKRQGGANGPKEEAA